MEARNLKKMDVRGSSGILLYLAYPCVIIKLLIYSRKAILYLIFILIKTFRSLCEIGRPNVNSKSLII